MMNYITVIGAEQRTQTTETFSGDGTTTEFTLTKTPISKITRSIVPKVSSLIKFPFFSLVGTVGIEPTLSSLKDWCKNQYLLRSG